MVRFVQGDNKSRATLLPAQLDDYVSEDNPVRIVDAFVDQLNLRELGFTGVDPEATERPANHPAV